MLPLAATAPARPAPPDPARASTPPRCWREWLATAERGRPAARGCSAWPTAGSLPLPVARWAGSGRRRRRDDAARAPTGRCSTSAAAPAGSPPRCTRAAPTCSASSCCRTCPVLARARRRPRACSATSSTPCRAPAQWRTVLLADGNVGIGGDAVRLLRRVRALLAPGRPGPVRAAPWTGDARRPGPPRGPRRHERVVPAGRCVGQGRAARRRARPPGCACEETWSLARAAPSPRW